jgi:ABC-type microcin C transport system permease subunit YejB
LLKLILFFQIVLLSLFLGAGYFRYSELQTLSTEVDNALAVIADIQSLLPKLEVAVDTVISLETAFQSLSGLSDILTLLLEPIQGNS